VLRIPTLLLFSLVVTLLILTCMRVSANIPKYLMIWTKKPCNYIKETKEKSCHKCQIFSYNIKYKRHNWVCINIKDQFLLITQCLYDSIFLYPCIHTSFLFCYIYSFTCLRVCGYVNYTLVNKLKHICHQ
jgi:hypothetical protein